MHFTLQTIVTTFALLNICAYANPITAANQALGILVTREEAFSSWCAGYSDADCALHCQSLGFYTAKCNTEYVN